MSAVQVLSSMPATPPEPALIEQLLEYALQLYKHAK